MAMWLWLLTSMEYWYLGQPASKMPKKLTKRVSKLRVSAEVFVRKGRVGIEGLRLVVREALSQRLCTFEYMGLLTILALSAELYLCIGYPQYFKSLAWKVVVAYVGSNHFLYGLHKTFPDLVIVEACVGSLLQAQETKRKGWTSFFCWNFSEHRLCDVWVHLGVAFARPWRVDHWFALGLHILKYSGCDLPPALTFPVHLGTSVLHFDDLVDVLAHTITALSILGPAWFFAAVLAGEFQRWILHADVANLLAHRSVQSTSATK